MTEEPQDAEVARTGGVRFEATVHTRDAHADLAGAAVRVAALDLDRIPDPDGGIRLLVGAEECTQLLEQGFEVRLVRAVPVRPLAPELIAADDDVRSWVHARVRRTGHGEAR